MRSFLSYLDSTFQIFLASSWITCLQLLEQNCAHPRCLSATLAENVPLQFRQL